MTTQPRPGMSPDDTPETGPDAGARPIRPSRVRVSRRVVLGGAAVTGAAGLIGWSVPRSQAATEFDQLRARWVRGRVGDGVDPADPAYAAKIADLDRVAAGFRDSMITSSDRTLLWQDLPVAGPTIANVSASYSRIESIATAWATPGTGQYGDSDLAGTLAAACQFLHDHGYNASMRISGNWWFWEIGIPKILTNICCLLHDHIAAEDLANYLGTIARFVPDPNYRGTGTSFAETGANRSDKALACVLRGILAADGAVIALGRDALSDVKGGGRNSLFTYVRSGDGFYADGSFIQHGYLPYVGTYGNVAISGVADLFALLGGSSWDIDDPKRSVILDAIEASFAPFIRNGHMMDTVRGRAVSRQHERDYDDGFSTIDTILLLATGVEEPYATRYRSLAKGWINRCTDASYLDQVTIPQLQRARAVLDDDSVVPAAESTGVRQFPAQERTVHRSDGWAFTVSTSSSRIGRYEWGNRENNLGWYQGDGMTYLYRDDDLSHFSDDYWPTIDPYRLPGITSSDAPRASGAADGTGIPRASQAWAGGVALGGRFGTVGMDHRNPASGVSAKKSWFLLGDGVVALGAGITGTGGHRIFTVIENRNQHDTTQGTVNVDGTAVVVGDGFQRSLSDPGWIQVPRLGAVSFPRGGRVQVSRAARTGTWYAINSGADTSGDTVEVTRSYLTLSFDHGVDPVDASYCYRLHPAVMSASDARKAVTSTVTVVANTPTVQAVRVPAQRLWLANFFGAGHAGDLTADGPCAVAVKSDGGRSTIAVSDPSRTATTVTVVLPMVDATTIVAADDGVEVVDLDPVTIRVTPAGGRTFGATLAS